MKTANIGIILVILLIGLCGCLGFGEKRACRKACTAIKPLETNLEITEADLEKREDHCRLSLVFLFGIHINLLIGPGIRG